MKKSNSTDNQFLRVLAFSQEDLKNIKDTAKKKGYTMPRLYHDAVLKGVAAIAKEASCE